MYQIYCDGASRSNPGEASIGVSINKNNTEIDTIKKRLVSTQIMLLSI